MRFTLQPVPANLSKVGVAKGGNPMGIPQTDHQCKFSIDSTNSGKPQLTYSGWTTLVDWQGENNNDTVRAAPIATTEKWKEL